MLHLFCSTGPQGLHRVKFNWAVQAQLLLIVVYLFSALTSFNE